MSRSRAGSRVDHVRCPNCSADVDALDWICAFCDHILDPSVLEGAENEEPPPSAWSSKEAQDPPDAMILGDVDVDPDGFRVVPGAGSSGDGKTSTLLFYTSTATTRVVRPDAIPLLVLPRKTGKTPTTPYEDFLLSCIDNTQSVREIQQTSGLTPQEVTITLLTLMDKGLVRFEVSDESDPEATPEPITERPASKISRRADSRKPSRRPRGKSQSGKHEDDNTISIELKPKLSPTSNPSEPKPSRPVDGPRAPIPPPLPKSRSVNPVSEPPKPMDQGGVIPVVDESDSQETQAVFLSALPALRKDEKKPAAPVSKPPPLPSRTGESPQLLRSDKDKAKPALPPPLPKKSPTAAISPLERVVQEVTVDRDARPPSLAPVPQYDEEPPTGEAEFPKRANDSVGAPIIPAPPAASTPLIPAAPPVLITPAAIVPAPPRQISAINPPAPLVRRMSSGSIEISDSSIEVVESNRPAPAEPEDDSSTELPELELPLPSTREPSGFDIVLSAPPTPLLNSEPPEAPAVFIPASSIEAPESEELQTHDLPPPRPKSRRASKRARPPSIRTPRPPKDDPKIEEPKQAEAKSVDAKSSEVKPSKAERNRHGSVDPARMTKAAKLYESALEEKAAGNFVSAKMNFKLAMTFDPTNPLYKQAYESASGSVQNAGERNAKSRTLYDRASQAERLGQVDEAIDLLEQAAEESRDPAVLNRLGVLLAMKRQEYKRARELIQEAIRLAPGNQVYDQNLKKVLTRAARAEVENKRSVQKKKGFLDGLLGRKK